MNPGRMTCGDTWSTRKLLTQMQVSQSVISFCPILVKTPPPPRLTLASADICRWLWQPDLTSELGKLLEPTTDSYKFNRFSPSFLKIPKATIPNTNHTKEPSQPITFIKSCVPPLYLSLLPSLAPASANPTPPSKASWTLCPAAVGLAPRKHIRVSSTVAAERKPVSTASVNLKAGQIAKPGRMLKRDGSVWRRSVTITTA